MNEHLNKENDGNSTYNLSVNSLRATTIVLLYRFHNPAEEKVIGHDVVPPLSDDIQLSVEEYRSKLYEVSFHNLFPEFR